MSIAPREAKCSIRRRTWAGHCALTQRTATCACILHHRAAAFRTFYRHPKFLLRSGAQILPHVHHRGNDFARFLDDNGIADANVFACDLFFVVQSRAAIRLIR